MKNRSFIGICLGVIFVHALFLWRFVQEREVVPPQVTKLLVQTVLLNSPPPSPKVNERLGFVDRPSMQLKRETPPKAIETERPIKPKEITAKRTPAEVPPEKQALLAKAQESLAKITKGHDKLPAKLNEPRPQTPTLSKLETEQWQEVQSLTSQEVNYREEVAKRLKLMLSLPEYGDVQLELTIDGSGSVKYFRILGAESAVNQKYVEKILPTLKFPPVGMQYRKSGQYTLEIILKNEV